MTQETDLFTAEPEAPRRATKSAAAFRTISEVAEDLDVPAHVLRFWETKFSAIRPLKRGGGRRYYRPEDVELLRRIRQLLYNEGYTIKGVQRLLKDGTKATPAASAVEPAARQPERAQPERAAAATRRAAELDPHSRRTLDEILDELKRLREMLSEHIH